MAGDGLAHRPAVLPGRMDSAGGHRRDDAGGVAGQDHTRPCERCHRAAAGNQPGADRAGREVVGNADAVADQRTQRVDVGRAGARGAMPECQTELHAGRVLRRPADVTGRERLVDEAVQGIRFAQFQPGEFVFHAVQEVAHAAHAETLCDSRFRAVGADQPMGATDPRQMPAAPLRRSLARRLRERLRQTQIDALVAHLVGQPAHQVRRVCGEEVVIRHLQRDVAQIRRVQAHAIDLAHQRRRHPVQPGALGGFLHDDAGGVELQPGIALALQHAHAQPVLRRGDGAGRAGKTGAHNHQVVIAFGNCSHGNSGVEDRCSLGGSGGRSVAAV